MPTQCTHVCLLNRATRNRPLHDPSPLTPSLYLIISRSTNVVCKTCHVVSNERPIRHTTSSFTCICLVCVQQVFRSPRFHQHPRFLCPRNDIVHHSHLPTPRPNPRSRSYLLLPQLTHSCYHSALSWKAQGLSRSCAPMAHHITSSSSHRPAHRPT